MISSPFTALPESLVEQVSTSFEHPELTSLHTILRTIPRAQSDFMARVSKEQFTAVRTCLKLSLGLDFDWAIPTHD